ncbi:MAG TPA: transglycosylase domain-containing protein [Tepidisphaeraceae bacterium]|jgi:penicillin-binding protein 1C|nr:transglycosylase domain-containing protein [Tepidisphaeraceae bacterium]
MKPASEPASQTPARRSKLSRLVRSKFARRTALAALAIPILACLGFLAAVRWWPYPAGIENAPAASTLIEDRNGVSLADLVAADQQWRIPLRQDQISPHLLDALVAVEDSRFYEHHGVDWRSAAMAAWLDVKSFHIRRGASTLTMQVQRLRDPRPRTFFNKFEQAVRAAQLEKQESKQQVLVEYVNRAPFGGNLVGAGAASWRYFGRPCAQLSLAEAALLAGLPQSPNRLRPDRFPDKALARRNHVLDRMRDMGMIDAKQHDEACAEPIVADWRALPQDRPQSAAAADGAMPTLSRLATAYPGTRLRCTVDAGIQRQVFLAASDHLEKLESSGVSAAAVVVLDTQTSECLAAVSLSRGTAHVDLTRSVRSTGSTLKPFIYATAFDMGICTPDTVLEDSPVAWAGYEPADYDRKFRGSVTAADALAESRNIPAMLVLAQVGVEPAVGVMDAAGLKTLARSPGRYGLSLAIGGAEASPMELAQGYAMLGRGGVAREVKMIAGMNREIASDALALTANADFSAPPMSRLRFRDSMLDTASFPAQVTIAEATKDLASVQNPSPQRSCLSETACWQTLYAISNPDRTSAICPAAIKTHVAWKTGTSNGHRDAWCAAVTRHRTIVVWMGNAGGQGSPVLVGAEAAAPLALRLIASLDTAPADPWPVVSSPSPLSAPRSHPLATTSLSLISPTAGEQFVLDRDISLAQQRVLLKASLRGDKPGSGTDSRTLWWFVDAQPAGVSDAGAQLWWEPVRGNHEIRVIDAYGHAAAANIVVK